MYQDNQVGVVSRIWSSSCDSLKARLPMIRICAIRASAPSSIAIAMPTRLRSSGVTVEVIFTEYLLRDRYCRLISCSARSRRARSNIRASARPVSLSAFLSTSGSNSFEPLMSTEAIAGRSSTVTIRTSPSTARRTSLKNPVPKRVLMASAALASVTRSPTWIGR